MRRALLTWAAAPLLSGCGLLYQVGGGGVAGLDDRPGRLGVEAQGHAGFGLSDASFVMGLGLSARARVTENVQQLAGGSHLFVTALADGPSPYLRVGTHFLQFERVDGAFGFGMASPFAEAGLALFDAAGRKRRGFFGTGPYVGLWIGYDTRLTDQPSEASAGITFGWAMGTGVATP